MSYTIKVKRWNTVGGTTNSIRVVPHEAAVLTAVKTSLAKTDTLISIIIDRKVEDGESRGEASSDKQAR